VYLLGIKEEKVSGCMSRTGRLLSGDPSGTDWCVPIVQKQVPLKARFLLGAPASLLIYISFWPPRLSTFHHSSRGYVSFGKIMGNAYGKLMNAWLLKRF
jgi:hypothetical protein